MPMRGKGGSRYKLPGSSCPEVGPGSPYVAYVFVFLGRVSLFGSCTN
jgi:hypothetical protein